MECVYHFASDRNADVLLGLLLGRDLNYPSLIALYELRFIERRSIGDSRGKTSISKPRMAQLAYEK